MKSAEPYFQDDRCTINHGDCITLLHRLHGIGAIIADLFCPIPPTP